jgi:hypothetical protein
MRQEVIDRWESNYTGLDRHPNMSGLKKWFNAEGDNKKPVALFVLSHHYEDSLFYDPAHGLTSSMINRTFVRPSFVVLNACRTVSKSKNGIVSKLDEQGVDAVIASLTNASAPMAGVFYRCFNHVLTDQAAEDSPTLADVFAKTIECVKAAPRIDTIDDNGKETLGSGSYGANAYKYTLLGNGNIRVCLDKGAKP